MYETKQTSEKIEEQFKDANKKKKRLEEQESKLRAKIEEVS